MRSIIIGLSTPISLKIGAACIRAWINRPYSHVFIQYSDDQDRALIFQASHGIVHLCSEDKFLSENNVIRTYKIELTDDEYQQFRSFYYDKLGEPYSYCDMFTIMIYDILSKFTKILIVPDAPGYVCSSLIAQMLHETRGISFDKPINMIRPDDIDMVLYKNSIL